MDNAIIDPAAQPQEGKEKGYSAKEQELIRQLVQARMEQKEELPFENLDGYELPPRTQFSMLKKPAVSIKYGRFTCNMACIRLLERVRYILPIVNKKKKRLPSWSWKTCSPYVRPIVFMIFSSQIKTSCKLFLK